MTTLGEVRLWGRRIGAVSLEDDSDVAAFAYDPDFIASRIEVSPLWMPLSPQIFSFPELSRRSFHGLPGMLADALPDKYGSALIDAWLAGQGRTPQSFNAVERLCYIGTRGMGALEFAPVLGPRRRVSSRVDIDALVQLASDVLTQRLDLHGSFAEGRRAEALRDILRVGTSAGGARAKAVIAWNPDTNEVRSGQVEASPGFGYWLMKFDGVANNRDKELADPTGYGAVEYAYSRMAAAAGIAVPEARLFEEGGRRHFMVRRFDRTENGGKLHMQSLAALGHYDFNDPRAYSYEQAFLVMRQLGLDMTALEEQYRRMVFNVIGRNQDDHVKNIAFLMDRAGHWSLSPAFDLTWSYNPAGDWTSRHQMAVNGKRDGFEPEDFVAAARTAGLARGRARDIVATVADAIRQWPRFAAEAATGDAWERAVASTLRLELA
jgi:serine/threonine-protein kinase HipA